MVTRISEHREKQTTEVGFDLASLLIEDEAVALDYIVAGEPTHIDFAVVEKR